MWRAFHTALTKQQVRSGVGSEEVSKHSVFRALRIWFWPLVCTVLGSLRRIAPAGWRDDLAAPAYPL